MMPNLCVNFLTYNRLDYAIETIRSFAENVEYDGLIHAHIADDGSPDWYLDKLIEIVWNTRRFDQVTTTNAQRGGYGRNYNLASQYTNYVAEYIVSIEDDWKLTRALDLNQLVRVLQDSDYGCIRLGYIGWTQELLGRFVGINGSTYLHLLPESPEPHVFAGHPRIETRDWQRSVGPWPEGLTPGETEFAVAHMPAAREGVLWPVDMLSASPGAGSLFAHIGTVRSY